MFPLLLQQVDDAIKYLASLDRVYSEHARPRFGKRSELFTDHDDSGQDVIDDDKRNYRMFGRQAFRDYDGINQHKRQFGKQSSQEYDKFLAQQNYLRQFWK